jgi:transposase InsO family protein
MVSGYWQVPLDSDAQEKAAFVTRNGLWKWKVLPFGLTSAPACFERLMEKVLSGLHWKALLVYLDDVIVFSSNLEEHLSRLREVLTRFRSAGLKLKPEKCEIFQTEVKYLGHIVSKDGVATDPAKIQSVKDWPTPRDSTGVRQFLGLIGYYRRYVPSFATIAKPLNRLTVKECTFKWDGETERAFQELKLSLQEAPILGYPDVRSPYILDTDASHCGIGAVLSQVQEGKERVIAYYSKTLSPPEHNYCVTRKELLAVVKAVKHFRPYLYGREFTLRTDHASLVWLVNKKEPSGQVARWIETLSEFQFQIQHRPGVKHGNADGMSRAACVDCKQCRRIQDRDGGPDRSQLQQMAANSGSVPEPIPPAPSVQQVTQPCEDLVKLQRQQGSDMAKLYDLVTEQKQMSEQSLAVQSREFAALHRQIDIIKVRDDGVMIIRTFHKGQERWCALCPPAARQTVIWSTHVLAHSGSSRTTARIRLQWYWPGMTHDIRRAIQTCEVCQLAKHGRATPRDGKQNLRRGRVWQTLAVDLVGPLPETARGNKWLLVLTDHFSRWQDAIPIADATSQTVATTLEERVFSYLGLPENLHTDQGAQFESGLMQELCTLWDITKTRTTPYNPKGNAIVERGNRGLGDSLRALLIASPQEEWDLFVSQIMRAIRATPHSSTGETANFMMMGREVKLPDDLLFNQPNAPLTTQSEYAQQLQQRLQQVHDQVRINQNAVGESRQDEIGRAHV